jgi:hypothetical protein
VTKILGYLSGIKVVGKPLGVREFEQLTGASEAARKHSAGLKDGSIQPISGTRRRRLPSSGRRKRR